MLTVMLKLSDYNLILLDFDGLLVNTEHLHFQSYKLACQNRCLKLNWSFQTYCRAAHYDNSAFQKQIMEEFPELKAIGWDVFYEEKKLALLDLYKNGAVQLMPGVAEFLANLNENNIKHAVVTHSPKILVEALCKRIPELQTIVHWVTREDYVHPKPHPECYVHALKKFSKPGDKVAGFEDTPRGLKALLHTPVLPVWVTAIDYPEKEGFVNKGVLHFDTFHSILNPN